MAKHPRPSVIEKIEAKQAAARIPPFGLPDLQNILFAARRGLASLPPADLVNASVSIAAGEAHLAYQAQAAAGAPTPPPPPPAEPPKA